MSITALRGENTGDFAEAGSDRNKRRRITSWRVLHNISTTSLKNHLRYYRMADASQLSSHVDWPSIDVVRASVKEYPQYISEQLKELDPARYITMPELCKTRREGKKGDHYLAKDEVLKLVQWKMLHGKFRPTLTKLVSSNDEAIVKAKTTEGFATADVLKALDALAKLSGIGPATASLLLSVNDPDNVPFFSDELFRFVHLEQGKDGQVDGWDRKIAYNKKEYAQMYARCLELRKRINEGESEPISMIDLEKHAYVTNAKRAEDKPAESTRGTKRARKEVSPKPKGQQEYAQAEGEKDSSTRPKRKARTSK